jgi:hypothetical protein
LTGARVRRKRGERDEIELTPGVHAAEKEKGERGGAGWWAERRLGLGRCKAREG